MTAKLNAGRHASRAVSQVVDLIGHTPLIRVRLWEQEFPELEVWGKAEWFNPGGSIKDRPALSIFNDALATGKLEPDRILVDSTSGNTGVGYALVGAAMGRRVKLVMPDNVSIERRELILAYGAEIVYSSSLEGSDGAIRLCRELVDSDPDRYFFADQYNNQANPLAHYNGTGVEILEQTNGRVSHLIAGLGTSGTFMGTSKRLKEHNPQIRCIAIEPDDPFHGLEGLKHMESSIVPGIWTAQSADEIWGAPTEPGYEFARRLARSGVLVGHSSGAVLWACDRLARSIKQGVVVLIFPDGGDRYLSSGLYRR